jgi:hypothetical protein
MVVAQGVFYKPAVNKQDETYALSEEAVYRVEKFSQDQNTVSKIWETSYRAAKYGGCFWEISTEPIFSYRIPPLQECIEPAEANDQGQITRWRQVIQNQVVAGWSSDELVLIPFLGEVTATWPFAPSLLAGLEVESEMLIDMEQSTKDYSEKQAWPYEVLQLGDGSANSAAVTDEDYSVARSEWRNRKPGEGIATRNMPVAIVPGGTGSAPIREIAVLCELMKDNIVDGTMIPPISKLYNSTEASSKEMQKYVMTALGQPWQWRITEYHRNYILKPWLESSGFSRKSCPQVLFESPDVHKVEEGQYWTSLVSAKIQTPQQACDHLGLEYDEDFWKAEELKAQMQFDKQLAAKKEGSAPKDAAPDTDKVKGKSYQVTELFDLPPKVHKHD